MPTTRDLYRQGLTALLADADRLGCTPDDIAARAMVLSEVRHAIAAGLGEPAAEEPGPDTLPHGLRAEDGWIQWAGGACPCLDWPEVEYLTRDGYRGSMRPKDLLWDHDDDPGDIIAYRRPRA